MLAIALRLGITQRALGCDNLLVDLGKRGAERARLLFDGSHLGFGSLKLCIRCTRDREFFGESALFGQQPFGGRRADGELLPLGLLEFQRTLKSLDRARLPLEKGHPKNPRGSQLVRRITPSLCATGLGGNLDQIAA